MKTWMVIYFNAVCCHPLYVKSVKLCNVNFVQSLAQEKKTSLKRTEPWKRWLHSASEIRDRVKHRQMRCIHSFISTTPPPPTPVLHRAPRSLGSALHAGQHLLYSYAAFFLKFKHSSLHDKKLPTNSSKHYLLSSPEENKSFDFVTL